MTNNYFEKFSDTDKKNYYDIRGVCKYDIENLYEDDQNQEEKSDFFYLIRFVKLIFWKLRFFKRIIKKWWNINLNL